MRRSWALLRQPQCTVMAVLLKCPPEAQRKLPVIWIWLQVWDVGSCPFSSIKFVLAGLHPMSKPWGRRVPNKQPAGSQGPPSQAAPGFPCPQRAGGGSSHSQKYPVDTDLGGRESGAGASHSLGWKPEFPLSPCLQRRAQPPCCLPLRGLCGCFLCYAFCSFQFVCVISL